MILNELSLKKGLVFKFFNLNIVSNSCSSSPCQNGATCYTVSTGAFYCMCTSVWTGTTCTTGMSFFYFSYLFFFYHSIINKNIKALANPCSSNPCQNGGICSPNLNTQTYTCTCLSGLTGTNCNIGNES